MKNVVHAILKMCVRSNRQRRRSHSSINRAVACEQLESRQLLSASGFFVDRGVLEFHGTSEVAEAVSLELSSDQSQILATVDAGAGPQTDTFELAAVEHFRFVGREMMDSLVNHSGLQTEVLMSHGSHAHGRLNEMEAMLDLVRYGDVTRTPVQSGRWFDAATWGGAENMPVDGDRVLVPEGQTLVVNGVVDASLMTVRVDGTLKFAHWKTSELRVDTMVVGMHGQLVMGTEDKPIRSHVTAKLVIDDYNGGFETTDRNSPDYDPYQLGNGLISHGTVTINGATKTSAATLAVEPSAGDSTLHFDSLPTDWQVGDELVIAGTNSTADGDEVRLISAIDATTGQVTLNSALQNNHHTPGHSKDGLTLKIHVGNTTRNAIIETAEAHRTATGIVTVPTGDTAANRTGEVFAERGHVMFMHSNDVQIANAGFYHLGRTSKMIPVHDTQANHMGMITEVGLNPRARYAVHFHRAGTQTTPARVVSSAVVNTPGWGFVNHSSHVDMLGNVAFDAVGAGFVTEAGDEAGSFVGNLSIRNHGSGVSENRRDSVSDFGHGGHGFWFQGPDVIIRDNVASGSAGPGIVVWPIGIDGLNDSVRNIGIREFTGNTIYGSDSGFLVGQLEGTGTEFVDTTIFGVREGLQFFYPIDVTYENTTIIGELGQPTGTGIKMQHRAGPFRFSSTHVEGFERGFETPRDGIGNVVDTAYLNNVENFAMINGRRHWELQLKITGDIEFGQLTTDALAGRTPYNFVMEESESAPDIARYSQLVLPYEVILDYNGLASPQRLYFDAEQSPDHIVWPHEAFEGVSIHRSNSDIPEALRGKTNTELRAIFNDMSDEERVAMFANTKRNLYQDYPDAYYSFAGGMRPQDSELTFPSDAKNAAFQALLPADDMVLNINFNDETATDFAPDGQDNSGQVQAGVTVANGVATFDGTGGIEIDTTASIDNSDVPQRTVTLSFVADDVSGRQVLFEEGGGSRGLNVYIENGQLYVGAWDVPAGFSGSFFSTPIASDTRYSMALILNAGEAPTTGALRGYLNGQQFGSASAQQINGHGSGTAFGAVNGRTRFHDGVSAKDALHGFIGTLDNLRIYNRAIDENEVRSLFELRLLDETFGEY